MRNRGICVRCFLASFLAALVLLSSQQVFAATPPSSNASILFHQLDTSGVPINVTVGGGSGGGDFAAFTGQHQGSMAPYLRLKMKMVNNGNTTGSVYNFAGTSTVPIVFEIYNLSGCDMVRTAYFPTAWANDGQYHDFDWTPASRLFNPNANSCVINPDVAYNVGVFSGYNNLDVLAATDASGTPYMITSVDPIDEPAIPHATPYQPGVIWQSASSHTDEISVNTPFLSRSTFNGTRYNFTIPLGLWDGPDFTTSASTTVHIWDRSAQIGSAIFDVGLAASSGGNPFVAHPTTVANLIYGYPYSSFIFTSARATSSVQELVMPTNGGVTIHHGDEMWANLYPSYAAQFYGYENVFVGGTGNVPQLQVCEGECKPAIPSSPACTHDCFSNVLFLPGVEASRLYRPDYNGGTNRLWEPTSDGDAHDLALNPDGSSQRNDIYTRDVIDEAYVPGIGPNIYKSFLARMTQLQTSGAINEFEPVPYDWRLSLDDILSYGNNVDGRLYYSGDLRATSTPFVIQELKRLAAHSKSGKVTIVAHSNGGLVAKALMLKLGQDASNYVDKIIFVAVPQVGTPAAIAGLLHGAGQNIPFLLSEKAVRSLAVNSPGAYNLAPSAAYFSSVGSPVVTFDEATLPDWTLRYGASIGGESQLQHYLTDSYQRVSPDNFDIKSPDQLNAALFAQADALHAALDAWTPPQGVQLIQIAGWGIPTTIKAIEYASTTKAIFCQGICEHGLTMTANTTIDGDGTVVVPSALWTSATLPNVSNYFVNIETYNKGHVSRKHSDIVEIDGLYNFIADTLVNSTQSLLHYTYISTSAPPSTNRRLRYTLHSPLTLELYDDQGRHTGINATTGEIEEQIPGTYYMELGGLKYLFTDTASTSHIVMNGYASGNFTFNVDEFQGDTLVVTTTFQDIPTTPQTKVTIDTIAGISALSPMHLDLNGDGITDYNLSPKLNGTVTLDITPPEIQIGFSTSTNSLFYVTTDDSGSATMSASTTYPILKKNQTGIATTTLTGKDSTGNTTVLAFTQKYPLKDKRISLNLLSIRYNGLVSNFASTTLKYKWNQNSDSSYKMLASFIQTSATSTESHWRPKKNLTILMTKPVDFDDSDSDEDADARPVKVKLPGLIVPSIVTQKDKINPSY